MTLGCPLVRMEGITVRFGNVVALDGVSFEIGRHEVVGLLGDNGAGKTTLVSTLLGLCSREAGTIHFDGKEVDFQSPKEARCSGIETKFQGSSLIETMSLARNFFLGKEPKRALKILGLRVPFVTVLDKERMVRTLSAQCRELDIPATDLLRQSPAILSGGQRDAFEISRALYFGAQLLILDEPTNALSEEEIAVVLNLIRKAKRNGISVVFITHKADEVFQVADRFVVLRKGKVFANIERSSLDLNQLQTLNMHTRLTAMRELASTMAHQVSSPLTVMKLSVEMLKDNFTVTEKRVEYAKITDMLARKIEAIQYMVKSMLDYVRPLSFRREFVSVADVIESAMEDLPLKNFASIQIDTTGVDSAVEYRLDKAMMRQAIGNLLLNALQSSPPAGTVHIRAVGYHEKLRIEIEDHGKGMKRETLENAINFFFTTKASGTGLGLPFVRRIVEKHGGVLTIESESKAGCLVRIEM